MCIVNLCSLEMLLEDMNGVCVGVRFEMQKVNILFLGKICVKNKNEAYQIPHRGEKKRKKLRDRNCSLGLN